MLKRPSFFLLLLSLLVTACIHHAPLKTVDNWNSYQRRLGAIDKWQFEGKLRIQVPDDVVRPRVHWQQNQTNYAIRLWGAFGQGTTWVYGAERGVRLERAGAETVYALSADQLLKENLGYDIPVDELQYWIRGVPAPRVAVQSSQLTPAGVLQNLEQSGWLLSYQSYERVGQWNLPSHIVATRGEMKITLRVSDWKIGD